jgi:hypothetical protein
VHSDASVACVVKCHCHKLPFHVVQCSDKGILILALAVSFVT